jgi:hypothetical protein
MAMPSSWVPPESGVQHVWSQLDTTRQQQAISVVARMAFNRVKIQARPVQQETDDDDVRPHHATP